MEKIVKSKVIIGIVLSVIMVFALSNLNIVRADDVWPGTTETTTGTSSTGSSSSADENDPFASDDWATPSLENNTSNNQTNSSVNNTVGSSLNEAEVVFNTTNNTTTNKVNSTTSNSNSLAKTGIEDSNGMLAVILVVAGIVAVYSFKKIGDYKNM